MNTFEYQTILASQISFSVSTVSTDATLDASSISMFFEDIARSRFNRVFRGVTLPVFCFSVIYVSLPFLADLPPLSSQALFSIGMPLAATGIS